MDNQTLIEILEGLKKAGLIYNDADFSRQTGIKPSHISEMKTGKKPFTGYIRRRIEETFPDFFNPMKAEKGDLTLSEMYDALVEHDRLFHATANRILDAMGVPREKGLASA